MNANISRHMFPQIRLRKGREFNIVLSIGRPSIRDKLTHKINTRSVAFFARSILIELQSHSLHFYESKLGRLADKFKSPNKFLSLKQKPER